MKIMSNIYIFIDESGQKYNTPKSDDCFMLHWLVTDSLDYKVVGELFDIRMKNHANHFYEFKGKSLEKFHAAEDEQAVRDQVFNTITTLDINKNIVFSVIMEKKKSFSWNNDNFYNHQRNAVKYLYFSRNHLL